MGILLIRLFDRYPEVEYPRLNVARIITKRKFAIDELGPCAGIAQASVALLVNANVSARWLVPEGGGEEVIRRARLKKGEYYICVEGYSELGSENVVKLYSTHDDAFNVYRLSELCHKVSKKIKSKEFKLEGAYFKQGVLIRVPIQHLGAFSKELPGWIYSTIKKMP